MSLEAIAWPLLGGALIGLSSALLLLLTGRIAGISGITHGLFQAPSAETGWRVAFVLGLVGGGALTSRLLPFAFPSELGSLTLLGVAGLLVGFGARLGSGCTSGHGVCGIGRLSPRALVATMTFITTGVLTVFVRGSLS